MHVSKGKGTFLSATARRHVANRRIHGGPSSAPLPGDCRLPSEVALLRAVVVPARRACRGLEGHSWGFEVVPCLGMLTVFPLAVLSLDLKGSDKGLVGLKCCCPTEAHMQARWVT